MDKISIYNKLPLIPQQLLINLEGWKLKQRRFGSNYKQIYEKVLQREHLSKEELYHYQEKRLRQVLKTAEKYSHYYKQLFKKYSFDITGPYLIERLKYLPILTKEQVKKHVHEILACHIPHQNLIPCHTSGTTGSGLHFYETRETEQERWATWWRYRNWHGITPNTWCAYFGGRLIVPVRQKKPPYWRKNIPGRQLLFSAYHLNPKTASEYVKTIRNSKITWLHGYPSILTLLAGFILENKLNPGQTIKYITTGAENLFSQQKKIIEKAFKVKVYQHYGLAESVANISECERGNLHVDEDYSIVELLPLGDGQYKIIGTSLINPAFLFLRYDTGDIVSLKRGHCPCGKPGRLIERIDGRKEDYIVTSDGRLIGRMDHIFKDFLNIHEAQIYQKQPEEIIIRVVKGKYYTNKDEKKLLKETYKRVGKDIKIIIHYVDKIKRTATGKLRLVISNLNEGKII